ncbi:hypothetical protein D5F52_03860 [Brevibacillus laterosporus]|nr:hypothetical protein D5F52_03860 [Brevibacillus laterosporus]PPA85879.1 hypothetical protein C4A75_07205 [Brevibacillus laterosporus]
MAGVNIVGRIVYASRNLKFNKKVKKNRFHFFIEEKLNIVLSELCILFLFRPFVECKKNLFYGYCGKVKGESYSNKI